MLVQAVRFTVMVVVMFALSVNAHAATRGDNLLQYLSILNDHTVACEDRVAAERFLIEASTRLDIVPEVFRVLPKPIYDPNVAGGQYAFSIVEAYAGYSGGASAEINCQYLPVKAQIAYARMRVWKAFARNGQPEEERKRIFITLFDEWETEFAFQQLISHAVYNHSPDLEQKLWQLFVDRELPSSIRISGATALRSITDGRYSRQIIEYVWSERGSDVATSLGGGIGGPRFRHPYLNVLKLDWYEREQARAIERAHPIPKNITERMDSYFGNITGLYEERRGTTSDQALAIVRQRNALRQEARETGDDTKLREFDAQVAEQQQQELQTRIERIDAWIATNRDRLEQEANDFARRRAEER